MNRFLPILAVMLTSFTAVAFGQAMPPDAPGAKDHPVISRYAGSWLFAAEERGFEELTLPSGEGKTTRVAGRMTRSLYIAPAGKTLADVQRNYQDALEKAGATRVDACAENCRGRDVGALVGDDKSNSKRSTGELEGYDPVTMLQYGIEGDGARYWYGKLKSAEGLLHVVVYSGKPGLIAQQQKYVATLVLVVQEKALETGKVQVDARAMAAGLAAEGKIALYGVYFDTGKSDLKPESAPQLAEMAKLLQADPRLKVYIVGHTDNQGALEANLGLSRARAQAVVDALVKTHKIDAKRLAAAGVASYAPVASNAGDAGRARNRRVELVIQ